MKELTNYHDGPISTISYYIHSFLSEKYLRKDTKVAISGTGADEIFTGYYDVIYYICNQFINKSFKKNLENWYKFVLPFIRNPNLKDPYLILMIKK